MEVVRRVLLVATASVLLVAPAAEARERQEAPRPASLAERRDRAITRARAWLHDHVHALPESQGTPRKPFTVALHGLIELWARDGTSVGRGRRTDDVERARRHLERWLDEVEHRVHREQDLPPRHGLASSAYLVQTTWPAAMALIFFAELESRGGGRRAPRPVLRRLAQLLADVQDPDGGWGHGPIRTPGAVVDDPLDDLPSTAAAFGRYPATLVSATYVVTAALGRARPHLGGAADGMGARAVAHLEASQLPGGLQPYDTSQRQAHLDLTGVSRAAGAAYALSTWGRPWTDVHQVRALRQVDDHLDLLTEGHGSSALNLFFAALLQRARGPAAWEAFRRAHLGTLLDAQDEAGRIPCICRGDVLAATNDSRPLGAATPLDLPAFRDGTDAYVTALGTAVLLLDRLPDAAPGPGPVPDRGATTPR